MTTKTLMQIYELAHDGWCDSEIARRVGLPCSSVRYQRMGAGIPVGEKGRKSEPPKRYTAYLRETSEYLCEGTVREIAVVLGMTLSSMRSIVSKTRRGLLNKYEFYEVIE